ncbi:Smr/MutS family protein [Aestuariivirga sp.]|uniref:Smr/MutS family protein n=1 Tax=Aestuariivirga sp. TaxID=2650926 RepID=UPI0025BBF268|nr:Smr/MutS family protein [Aestuariivirga sp.]MCA3554322.1 Smr/MutS family protein [Aestuariivirga sp.]
MSRKPPDYELWLETAKTVKPLRAQSRAPAPKPAPPLLHAKKSAKGPSGPHMHVLLPPHRPPPQITGLDRRTAQKLTRGQVEIERRLDLHGTGIELARVHLLGFLRDAQSMGTRNVLVITGKGASPFSRHTLHGAGHFHAPERAGRLRRLVTEWFHEPEFRSLVAGFQPAHPKHGGGGAYYVRVRRIREER